MKNSNNNPLIEQFIAIYSNLNAGNVDELNKVYSADIEFIDPLHRLSGFPEVRKYIQHMYANISDYQLAVLDCVQGEGTAYLSWRLAFRHPGLNARKRIEFDGVSRLDFTAKIDRHQDFYDLGAMLYEHIPVFGSIVRTIKAKAAR